MFVSLAFKPIVLKDPTLLKDAAFIHGRWYKDEEGPVFTIHDAATGIYLTEVPNSSRATLNTAIQLADTVFPVWQKRPPSDRIALLANLNELILDNLQDLANIIRSENGKSLAEAKQEIHYASAYLEHLLLSKNPEHVEHDVLHNDGRPITLETQPIGVCAGISNLDFPLASAVSILAPALLSGCTVVLVTAQSQPLSALAIAELAMRAGFPAGVMNVLTCESSLAVTTFLSNATVRKISVPSIREITTYEKEACTTVFNKAMLESEQSIKLIVMDDADCDLVCSTLLALASFKFNYDLGREAHKASHKFHVYAQKNICAHLTKKMMRIASDHLMIFTEFGKHEAVPFNIDSLTFKKSQELIEKMRKNHSEAAPAIYFFTRDIDQIWPIAAELNCQILGINPCLIQSEISVDCGLFPLMANMHSMCLAYDEYSVITCSMGG
ncbi:MAG: aldehyde dehydrogenase family protein [Candidatus Aquirickettsiella gammari]